MTYVWLPSLMIFSGLIALAVAVALAFGAAAPLCVAIGGAVSVTGGAFEARGLLR